MGCVVENHSKDSSANHEKIEVELKCEFTKNVKWLCEEFSITVMFWTKLGIAGMKNYAQKVTS